MEFFNKKEEVLEVQLTEYGRMLLNLGRLKPEFYAFLDDGILYDNEAAGYEQDQNNIDRRIQYNTPAAKPQTHVVGAETRQKWWHSKVESKLASIPGAGTDNSVDFLEAFQWSAYKEERQLSKDFMVGEPLGTSGLTSENAPAWSISMLTNEVSASGPQVGTCLTGTHIEPLEDGVIQNIPQLDITVDYQTFFAPSDVNLASYNKDKNYIPLTPELNADGIRLFVEDKYLVVEVLEENTDYLKENFDIEVFKMSVHTPHAGSPVGSTGPRTRLLQLFFRSEDDLATVPAERFRDVPYYLNILVDNELPVEVAEQLGINKKVIRGTFPRRPLVRDLYGDTSPDEGCE